MSFSHFHGGSIKLGWAGVNPIYKYTVVLDVTKNDGMDEFIDVMPEQFANYLKNTNHVMEGYADPFVIEHEDVDGFYIKDGNNETIFEMDKNIYPGYYTLTRYLPNGQEVEKGFKTLHLLLIGLFVDPDLIDENIQHDLDPIKEDLIMYTDKYQQAIEIDFIRSYNTSQGGGKRNKKEKKKIRKTRKTRKTRKSKKSFRKRSTRKH